mmetsp:Transcript_21421/g.43127  ORF Transcript_21421/g.43127 Transcript_21421/m.43127 type:complete len:287 (+) Transcript_21421:71-931(+)
MTCTGAAALLSGLIAVACGPLRADALTVISASRSMSGLAARSAEWRSCLEEESNDMRFWTSEWADLEVELTELQAAVNGTAAKTPAAAASLHHHSKSPLAGLKLNLEPKSPADLVPALAMLKGLYEDGKERIGKLNAREKEAKLKFEERQAAHNHRMQEIEARFKNGTLSAEFRTNETHDENRLWSYWEKVRERQHKQYHTSLKIQHGTLEKVKAMIDMYEKTIAGTADKQQVAKQLAKVSGGAMPEVVFLQASEELAHFCKEALTEVRMQRAALLQTSSSSRAKE